MITNIILPSGTELVIKDYLSIVTITDFMFVLPSDIFYSAVLLITLYHVSSYFFPLIDVQAN